MFTKILVALDQSSSNELVFEKAFALARLGGGSLMLMHVLSGDEDNSPGLVVPAITDFHPLSFDEQTLAFYRREWERYEQLGRAMLQMFAERAAAVGVIAEFSQSAGSPGPQICQLARAWGADLIVTGRRGRRGISEMLLGSISNYVLHHAPCSVLVVTGAEDEDEPLPIEAGLQKPATRRGRAP
ncbi:MAG: universal stress protein [Aphanocapsa lilacina HA4352-LM1]|jgi:nucleotide-binding universal stress UspA family protein|nr:universal stress protein [Aphanocapsa lilacina HA4352-LM1]